MVRPLRDMSPTLSHVRRASRIISRKPPSSGVNTARHRPLSGAAGGLRSAVNGFAIRLPDLAVGIPSGVGFVELDVGRNVRR